MDTFPAGIRPPSSITGGVFDPLEEATMDTGDAAARPVFSMPRQQPWKMEWAAMPFAEYNLLTEFQKAQRASVWLYTHPRSGQTWEMRFKSDPIAFSEQGAKWRTIAVTVTAQPIRRVS